MKNRFTKGTGKTNGISQSVSFHIYRMETYFLTQISSVRGLFIASIYKHISDVTALAFRALSLTQMQHTNVRCQQNQSLRDATAVLSIREEAAEP